MALASWSVIVVSSVHAVRMCFLPSPYFVSDKLDRNNTIRKELATTIAATAVVSTFTSTLPLAGAVAVSLLLVNVLDLNLPMLFYFFWLSGWWTTRLDGVYLMSNSRELLLNHLSKEYLLTCPHTKQLYLNNPDVFLWGAFKNQLIYVFKNFAIENSVKSFLEKGKMLFRKN